MVETERSFEKKMRKRIVGLVARFGVPILLSAGVACANDQGIPVEENKTPSTAECNLSLKQVKLGTVSPEDYLQGRDRCLPEVIEAKNSGMLKGFLYNPSNEELEKLLGDVFSERTSDSERLERLVQSSIESYKSIEGDEVGTIIPGIVGVFGEKVPSYVVFREEFFSSPAINNDADVRSIVNHELQHVKDWYEGISLNDIHLSYDTIYPGTLRIEFLQQLMELRAVYAELEDIFDKKVNTDSVSVSQEWLGSQAANYFTYWDSIVKYPTTDLEKRVRELQFEQFKGITPKVEGDQILITFNLFGKQEIAKIEKTP